MDSACPLVYEDPRAQTLLENPAKTRRALFLDRDGVINKDVGYVHEIAETAWLPGIFELCSHAAESDYLLIVTTNQAGIARGLYGVHEFMQYSAWIHDEFSRRGIILLATFACPHHPFKGRGSYLLDCDCRKPRPGMFNAAKARYRINLDASAMIGDKSSDVAAARAAGIKQTFLVGSSGLTDTLEWLL